MNLNQLEYFSVLAKTQHYTKAAKILHITQPSLSNAISKLEDELGTKLFVKTGRSVKLSKMGEEFVDYIDNSLEEIDLGIKRLEDLKNNAYQKIRISFLYTLSSDFIPQMISDFLESRNEKNFRFQLSESTTIARECTTEMIEGLKNDRFEAIFVNRIDEKDSELQFTKITEQNYVAIVNKNSFLAEYDTLDLRDTKEVPFIQYSSKFGTRDEITSLFKQVDVEPKVYAQIEDEMSILALVKAGVGYTITPMKKIYNNIDEKILPISNPANTRDIYIGYKKNSCKSPFFKKFIDFIENEFELNYEVGE
ncbi:LysR family transcriptional regulator [Halanaerobium salsuginis]|jgi:DNA-binding transcriptional LysR family regulator|uniref:DNA-binding transcriptional regulator, LysR family n=1 Tax=Halanaerobium salsuginis TaxID=29563 RepID=A0A1I4JJY6_9FIRM|nr:LysR family transcriptional regulator [Halanaerobium salsuginis]SFL66513.1 DNA-binding transcriptional regulator, LysR family [Halanaerobium salsuginis]